MNYRTPEEMGISSLNIKSFVDMLEEKDFSTHSLIIARGDSIVFEKYWAPFHKDFLHRQYSVSKSFVGIAVGFALDDGLFSLDDRMIDLFPEELKNQRNENIRNQTVRNMLMMSTSRPGGGDWFNTHGGDRVYHYFNYPISDSHPAGTVFHYDSEGSFVLSALVERKTGKRLMDYLREKLFDKIGVSKDAYCLECPGGHSWGDSGILCTTRDLLLVTRFMLNEGSWNGEQLLSREYARAAVSKQIDNNIANEHMADDRGYGYLIWRTYDNSWFFNGMGCQFAIASPDTDVIMVINSDNQGRKCALETIVSSFFSMINRRVENSPLPENPEAVRALDAPMSLSTVKGEAQSTYKEIINGKTFVLKDNSMKITKIGVNLRQNDGELRYTNATGDKVIRFGILKNTFDDKFPEDGYSDGVGALRADGNHYKYAASAAWVDEHQLHIKVQIIDKYFGRLDIRLSFTEDLKITLRMLKVAENFLDEYNGWAEGSVVR